MTAGHAPTRLFVALAALVAGVSGVVVVLLLSPLPLSRDDDRAAVNRAAAEEFYAAQDAVLTTGDTQGQITSLDPAFIDHRPGSTAGLAREVAALRAVRPPPRLTSARPRRDPTALRDYERCYGPTVLLLRPPAPLCLHPAPAPPRPTVIRYPPRQT